MWAILTSFDTGLDTTSAFQKVTYGVNGEKENYCYPSIYAAERCRYEQALAKISEILGTGKSEKWLEESKKTKQAMDQVLWDSKRNWYGVLHACLQESHLHPSGGRHNLDISQQPRRITWT